MHQRGQKTTFQIRLQISEQAASGLNDSQIASADVLLCLDGPQVATTITKAGTQQLHLADGTSSHWPGEYVSSRMKGGYPSATQTPPRLGASYSLS